MDIRMNTSRFLLVSLSAALFFACGGGKGSTRGGESVAGGEGGDGARTALAAPAWFHTPPKGARSLFFVGDANGASDEGTARELAVQKALAQLTVYCGASIKSDFTSLEREAAMGQPR